MGRGLQRLHGGAWKIRGVERLGRLTAIVGALCAVGVAGCGGDSGDAKGDGGASTVGDGITQPVELKAFTGAGSSGTKPDLPKRIGFVQDNDREFMLAVRDGVSAAAEDRGLEFKVANSNGDPAKNVEQLTQFLAQGVGALVVNPVDPAAQAPVMKEALKQGVAVEAIVFGPATLQVNAPQYKTGQVLGAAAADYIENELGGKANVVILNQDSVELVRPRFKAIRDEIKKVPGAEIVADVEPDSTDKEGAFETMNTILQKTPQVDVVLGADSVALGALAALEAAKKASPKQFIGGVDGEPEALAKIAAGDGPYKASVGLAPGPFAYAVGQFAADWLEGKTIPQGLSIEPRLLTSAAEVEAYDADTSNPKALWDDAARRDKYLQFYGEINYDSRGNYLAYNWTL